MFFQTYTARRLRKLTLTFKLVRARDHHVFPLNLVQISSAVPEIFYLIHKQKCHMDSAKNRTLRSSLRAVNIKEHQGSEVTKRQTFSELVLR